MTVENDEGKIKMIVKASRTILKVYIIIGKPPKNLFSKDPHLELSGPLILFYYIFIVTIENNSG